MIMIYPIIQARGQEHWPKLNWNPKDKCPLVHDPTIPSVAIKRKMKKEIHLSQFFQNLRKSPMFIKI